jgi:hypothetical protein
MLAMRTWRGGKWRPSAFTLALLLSLASTFAACGDDDTTRRISAGAGEAGTGAGAGAQGDAGQGTSGAAGTAPGEFAISGITGDNDTTADAWLLGGTTPTVEWSAAAGAEAYEVTIYGSDGATVACETTEHPGSATSALLEDCSLTEGVEYHASVVATGGGVSTPADNAPFPFAVSVIVFGQPDALTNEGIRRGLSLPNDVIAVGSRLIVADQNNSRVLVYDEIPTQNHALPSLVLGQPDLSTGQPNYGGDGPRGFRGSNSVASDGTRLIVGDRFNNRVLIWSTFPTQDFQAADVVLGQPNFTSTTPNTGGISAQSMTEPWVWLCGQKLLVADRLNVRVLIYNTIPTQNHAAADLVLGQPDMISSVANNGGLGPQTFADPGRGHCDGNRLLIPDLANHRVLIWNSIPTQNNAAADRVLGQPNMLSNQPNAGGISVGRAGLSSPIAAFAEGGMVAVADYLNNRVLLWTSPIAQNGQAADVILGQPDAAGNMANAGGEVTAASMASPNAIAGDGTRLFVSDRFNHRVLIYSALPDADGAQADLAVGQPDLVSGRLNNQGPVSSSTLANPGGVSMTDQGLALTDNDNARVLLWEQAPTSSAQLPSFVLGQPDFDAFGQFGGGPSARSLCAPSSVHSDGVRLVVGEACARRVAIWNELPSATHAPLDFVVGQPNVTSDLVNNGGVSGSSLSFGPRPHVDGDRLFVADPQNHRVLIWNTFPTTNGAAADVVLGQPNSTSSTVNNGGLGAASLSRPTVVYVSDEKLFVSDSGNNRVLVWNAIPTDNQAPADLVLGQPNMTSGTAAAPAATTLAGPGAIHVDGGGRLYVIDGNHRILYWDEVPSENQVPAAGVIGQPDLSSGLANNGGLGAGTLQGPSGIVSIGDLLYVSDSGNSRLLIMPRP